MALNEINLSELQWNTRGEWPIEIKVLLCILISISSYVLVYFFLIKPEFHAYDEAVIRQRSLRGEFERKYDQTVNLAAYQLQIIEMEKRFGALLKALPSQNEMPALLSDISKTGTNIGLTFVLFAPQKEIIHEGYVELPVNIGVIGSYQQLAVFVSRVAQISRIITLHDFEIQYATQGNTGLPESEWFSQEKLEMKMNIKIYRYRS